MVKRTMMWRKIRCHKVSNICSYCLKSSNFELLGNLTELHKLYFHQSIPIYSKYEQLKICGFEMPNPAATIMHEKLSKKPMQKATYYPSLAL